MYLNAVEHTKFNFWLASHNDFWPILIFKIISKKKKNNVEWKNEQKNTFFVCSFRFGFVLPTAVLHMGSKAENRKINLFPMNAEQRAHEARDCIPNMYINIWTCCLARSEPRNDDIHSIRAIRCDSNKRNLQLHVRCVISLRI